MKAPVTLSHDTSVADHKATMLEFQRVVQQHYRGEVREGGCGNEAATAQRGTASKGRSSSDGGPGPKRKGKSGVSA